MREIPTLPLVGVLLLSSSVQGKVAGDPSSNQLRRSHQTYQRYFTKILDQATRGRLTATATVPSVVGHLGICRGPTVRLGVAKVQDAFGRSQIRLVGTHSRHSRNRARHKHKPGAVNFTLGLGVDRYAVPAAKKGKAGLKADQVLPSCELSSTNFAAMLIGGEIGSSVAANGARSWGWRGLFGWGIGGPHGELRNRSFGLFSFSSRLLRLARKGKRVASQVATALDNGELLRAEVKIKQLEGLKAKIDRIEQKNADRAKDYKIEVSGEADRLGYYYPEPANAMQSLNSR
jgi:hypothetical protein